MFQNDNSGNPDLQATSSNTGGLCGEHDKGYGEIVGEYGGGDRTDSQDTRFSILMDLLPDYFLHKVINYNF